MDGVFESRRAPTAWPWMSALPVLALLALGLVNLQSATATMEHEGAALWERQWIWSGVGLALLLGAMAVDYRLLDRMAYGLYGLAMVLLIAVLIKGSAAMGAQRWMSVGGLRVQPSEPAKLALVVVLAHYFQSHWKPEGYGGWRLLIPLGLILLPMGLVVIQPDLGTAGLIGLIGAILLLFARVRWRALLLLTLLGAGAIGAGYTYGLKDYQRKRIESFLDPQTDPKGSGYHVIQSKIAIGSGGLTGKGFGKGTQAQLRFLPEQHTDFAFAVYAEEWGFAGVALALALFAWIVAAALVTASEAKETFGAFLAVGISAYFGASITVNLGMIAGLLPVVGIPLPFFSYGGSTMITTMLSLGLLANVRRRRVFF